MLEEWEGFSGSVMVGAWVKGRLMDEQLLRRTGVASPETWADCSAERSLRPIRISSQRPEKWRFHLKPLRALLEGCSLPESGVMRAQGKLRSLRARELTDDVPEAVLFLSGVGSSSMMGGTSLEGEEIFVTSLGLALVSE